MHIVSTLTGEPEVPAVARWASQQVWINLVKMCFEAAPESIRQGETPTY